MRPAICVAAASVALAVALPGAALAQDTSAADRAAVLAAVQRLFDGMRANDADMVRSVVANGAVLIQTENQDGQPVPAIRPMDGFADAVGSATEPMDEPFWDPVVQVHDHLATVWTKYAFYMGGTFSHCGYDAFTLVRSAEGWKIAAIADTRERENCELPPGR